MRSDSINRIAISSTARTPSTESFEKAPDLASPCCPSKENSCFKENINVNKSGASNLSLDPQQMKRKKKGGKNNLRKSLAWDRAFFTEEGVLDPLELSAISGVSCGGGLPFISEDNLVRSGQDIHSRNDKENDLSPPKLNLSSSNRMAATSLPSHKAPTNTGSKLGSKYADCPRASPSPSLKRRANANVGKALGSELRLPKVPGLKPGLSPTCASTRSTILRGSRVKQNQITQPDFSIQRDMELNSYLKSNTKNAQNTSRPTALQSARHSNGDLGSSSFNRHVSINMIPMTVDKVNSDSKMIPLSVTQIRRESSCNSQPYDSATFASSYSQNAHVNVKTLPPLLNQTTKPSGLRMPSPSLSFFSQPKPSSYRDLPLRGIHLDVYGSQNRGSLRLLDNLSRTTKLHDRIPDSRISSSKAICSRSEFTASSNVSVIDLAKPKLDQKPMHEIQELPKKNEIVRISREEAEVQKIDIEVSSQNGSQNHSMDSFLKNNIDDCPVKGESCESEWSNSELVLEQNYAIPESQTINAADEQPAKNKICNILVLNHDSTQSTDGFDDRVQNTLAMHSDWNKSSCKPDCHEAHLEITDPLLLGENEKRTDKNISQERATEKLDVSQQNRIYCIKNMKASEQGEAMAESPCFESNHQYGVKILTDDLPVADAQMQNSVFASIVERCNNDTKLMPEVDNDINQTGESSEAQDFHQKVAVEPMPEVVNDNNQTGESSEAQDFHQKVAVEPKQIGKLNKRLSHQNLQYEENIDELLLVASDRKDGNKVIPTKLSFSQSLGKRRKNNLGKETGMARPLRMDECDSVGNSFSSESCNSPVSTSFDCDEPPCIQIGSVEYGLSSTMSLKDSESDIDTLKSLQRTKTMLVQSLESNMLNNCCFQQSESMALAGDEFVAENLVLRNDSVPAKHLPDVFSEDNTVGSVKTSVTNEEVYQVISRSSNLARESPSKSEICNEVFETGGAIEDTITDSSRVSFSDTINVGVSLDDNNSLSCLRPKLDCDKVESTLLPNNVHGDGLEEKKSLSVVIPPNATPFSDEWLAAIEAAGEDILTKKSGAVQNSPPDKSIPEPSPWSPVKRKNNQIGPFDCTKKFAAPSQP